MRRGHRPGIGCTAPQPAQQRRDAGGGTCAPTCQPSGNRLVGGPLGHQAGNRPVQVVGDLPGVASVGGDPSGVPPSDSWSNMVSRKRIITGSRTRRAAGNSRSPGASNITATDRSKTAAACGMRPRVRRRAPGRAARRKRARQANVARRRVRQDDPYLGAVVQHGGAHLEQRVHWASCGCPGRARPAPLRHTSAASFNIPRILRRVGEPVDRPDGSLVDTGDPIMSIRCRTRWVSSRSAVADPLGRPQQSTLRDHGPTGTQSVTVVYPAVAVRPNATPRYAPPKRSFRPEPRSPPVGEPDLSLLPGVLVDLASAGVDVHAHYPHPLPPFHLGRIHRGVAPRTSTVAGTAIAPLSPRLADRSGRYRGAIGPAVAGGRSCSRARAAR